MTITMNQLPQILAEAQEESLALSFANENELLDRSFLALYEEYVEQLEEEEWQNDGYSKYEERQTEMFLFQWEMGLSLANWDSWEDMDREAAYAAHDEFLSCSAYIWENPYRWDPVTGQEIKWWEE